MNQQRQAERLIASIRLGETRLSRWVVYPVSEWCTDRQDPELPGWRDPTGIKRIVFDCVHRLSEAQLRRAFRRIDRKYR